MLDYVKAKQKAARELTCVSCGEPFIALRSDVKYCKNACRLTAQRKHKAELRPAKHAHTCAECGKTIVSQRSTKKYCSSDCRNAWWNHSRPHQSSLFATAARPASGPRCACGTSLYHYEVRLGKCIKCARSNIIQARETVPTRIQAAMTPQAGGD
jgi:hypothetical protein